MPELVGDLRWTDIATAIGSLVGATTILLGLMLALFQLRSVNRTREIDALTDRSTRWEDASMVESRLAVSKIGDSEKLWKYLNALEPGKSEEWYLYMRIPHFFEDVGVATLKVKVLKEELVYDLFAAPIETYWGYYQMFVEEFRKVQEDERLLEWFEKLARECERARTQ